MRALEAVLERSQDHWGPRPAAAAATDRDLVERHVVGVFRFLRSLGASREEAEDLTQEVFVVAWRKGKQHLATAALAAFLRRAGRLLWLEHRRRERRAEAAITALTLTMWEREVEQDGESWIAAARACVLRLRGRAARAVELAYRDGASRDAIATELGMRPNGVKTLLARTRAWLEQCIRRSR